MFFKREKNTPISFIAILEKYDINPVNLNIASSYDEELHTPAVLTKYLGRDIKFLVAILEANKGHLAKDGELYKNITDALRFAEYDLERAKNNLNSVHSKRKKIKNKNDMNIESEWNAANHALKKCQTHFDRMESF
ncbi:TPA: Dot/Icm T4SS effector Lem16, partial [Legionella pneumophila]|nr:Dot/Icm T4SS effector Lem16 [Legionella pneumophila]